MIKRVRLNELIVLEGRVYRIEWSKYSNGKTQGNRAILKLLDSKKLNALAIWLNKKWKN
jgi:hypothetical protein